MGGIFPTNCTFQPVGDARKQLTDQQFCTRRFCWTVSVTGWGAPRAIVRPCGEDPGSGGSGGHSPVQLFCCGCDEFHIKATFDQIAQWFCTQYKFANYTEGAGQTALGSGGSGDDTGHCMEGGLSFIATPANYKLDGSGEHRVRSPAQLDFWYVVGGYQPVGAPAADLLSYHWQKIYSDLIDEQGNYYSPDPTTFDGETIPYLETLGKDGGMYGCSAEGTTLTITAKKLRAKDKCEPGPEIPNLQWLSDFRPLLLESPCSAKPYLKVTATITLDPCDGPQSGPCECGQPLGKTWNHGTLNVGTLIIPGFASPGVIFKEIGTRTVDKWYCESSGLGSGGDCVWVHVAHETGPVGLSFTGWVDCAYGDSGANAGAIINLGWFADGMGWKVRKINIELPLSNGQVLLTLADLVGPADPYPCEYTLTAFQMSIHY